MLLMLTSLIQVIIACLCNCSSFHEEMKFSSEVYTFSSLLHVKDKCKNIHLQHLPISYSSEKNFEYNNPLNK